MIKLNKKAFTLVEMVVVIAVIGILTTIAVVAVQNSRRGVRDAKRVADIKQIQTALRLYYNNVGSYPEVASITASNTIEYNGIVYMSGFPQAPTPADGNCDSSNNEYIYIPKGVNNSSYVLSFCLGGQIGNLTQGEKCANPKGILSASCFGPLVPAGFSNLFSFDGTNGSEPWGDLISYNDVLYGMTYSGGTSNYGTIFKINPDGTGFEVIHNFNRNDINNGANPYGSLISYNDFLYGMTYFGGANDSGIIFKIEPNGDGFNIVYNFNWMTDGANPYKDLTVYGNTFYGMTYLGGAKNSGIIFKIEPNGDGFQKLHNFEDVGTNGSEPWGNLIVHNDALYGMTSYGGDNNGGIMFKIDRDGNNFEQLYSFDGNANPQGSLVEYNDLFYGMTVWDSSGGTVFKINPDGNGFETIYNFNGGYPYGSLIVKDNILYGMTTFSGDHVSGIIFQINLNGDVFNDLSHFDGGDPDSGLYPLGSLFFYSDALYGMTSGGGANDKGTIFSFGL